MMVVLYDLSKYIGKYRQGLLRKTLSSCTKSQLLYLFQVLYHFEVLSTLSVVSDVILYCICLAFLQHSDFNVSNQSVPELKLDFFPQMSFDVSITSPVVGFFFISIFLPLNLQYTFLGLMENLLSMDFRLFNFDR